MTAPRSIAAGQTETISGDIRSTITLGASSTLDIAGGTEASLFGGLVALASASVTLGAGAVLFAPAMTPTDVTVVLGDGSELILVASTLADFKGHLASLPLTAWLDITGCRITTVTTTNLANGYFGLVLGSAQGVIGTIEVNSAPSTLILAIPDGFDGSVLLSGPAPPPVAAAAVSSAPAGTFTWTGGSGASWSTPTCWSNAEAVATRAPSAQDMVTITGGSSGLTTLAGNGDCAVLDVSGLVALAGSFSATVLTVGIATTDALILTRNTYFAATNASVDAGILSVQSATLSVAGTLEIAGYLDVSSASVVKLGTLRLDSGTLRLSTDSGITIGTGASPKPGILVVSKDGTLTGTGTIHAAIALSGRLEVMTGTLSIFGSMTGMGTITLDDGATLFASGGVGAATIAFAAGSGTTLETFGILGGALVTGFGQGDELQIAGAASGSITWTPAGSGGTLDLGVYGALAIDLTSDLDPQRVTFVEAADGEGGTSITVLPCFIASTPLRTPTGWIAAGDVTPQTWLCTAAGAARRVVWIGRTTIEGWRRATEPYLDPVLFRADALGPGRPIHDLRLSPLHGVVLATAAGLRIVPAVALCDGKRITRERSDHTLVYVHVALSRHDVLLADGLPCESFLPHGPDPRGQFTLSLGDRPPTTQALAERLEHGPLLSELRHSLGLECSRHHHKLTRATVDFARQSGRSCCLEAWTNYAGGLELLVDGQAAWRGQRDIWRADLEAAGIDEGRAAFKATIPRPTSGAQLSIRQLA